MTHKEFTFRCGDHVHVDDHMPRTMPTTAAAGVATQPQCVRFCARGIEGTCNVLFSSEASRCADSRSLSSLNVIVF